MITIEIKADTSRFDRTMADFPAAMARARRVALLKIGSIVKTHARDAIKGKALRPSVWPPRKKAYKHPPLRKTTHMWNSIDSKMTAPDTVVVGTPHEYAIYHQFGTKRMPARPFFPVDKYGSLTPDMARKIDQIIGKAYSEALKG
jgi:phage gpG-like protein